MDKKIPISERLRCMIQDAIEDDNISDSQLQARIYDAIEMQHPGKYSDDEKYEIFWQELAE